MLSVAGRVQASALGGGKLSAAVSYDNGQWDFGVLTEHDIPGVSIGKILQVGVAIEVSHSTGSVESQNESQAIQFSGAAGKGGSVSIDKMGMQAHRFHMVLKLVVVCQEQEQLLSLVFNVTSCRKSTQSRTGLDQNFRENHDNNFSYYCAGATLYIDWIFPVFCLESFIRNLENAYVQFALNKVQLIRPALIIFYAK